MITTWPRKILAHLLGWVLFASLIGSFATSTSGQKNLFNLVLTPQFSFFILIYVLLFYLNGYYLFPKLYLKKNYVAYFTAITALAVLAYFLEPFDQLLAHGRRDNYQPPRDTHKEKRKMGPPTFEQDKADSFFYKKPPPREPPVHNGKGGGPSIDIVSIVLLIMTCAISSVIPIIKQWQVTEKRALQAEADKANAELSFLRAQINPHFLFNTLNNIYTLAVTKNDVAPQAIMKLSNMLRFVTDEATQDFVPLEKEVDCIKNYIALQQLRLDKNVIVQFSVDGPVALHKLPPLILMTFVENVFKHGITSHNNTLISIAITAEEKSIRFICRNSIFHQQLEEDRKGIGINNAKQRLNHLYPNRHRISIENQDDQFIVTLDLEIIAI